MKRSWVAGSLCVWLALAALAWAQPPARGNSPRQQVNGGFEARSPRVGEKLPEVTAYDAAGEPFSLRSLEGHYSVLVFGCLT